MNRTRSQRGSRLRTGLLVAIYALVLLLPSRVAAAEAVPSEQPVPSATPRAPDPRREVEATAPPDHVADDDATSSPAPRVEPRELEPPTAPPSITPPATAVPGAPPTSTTASETPAPPVSAPSGPAMSPASVQPPGQPLVVPPAPRHEPPVRYIVTFSAAATAVQRASARATAGATSVASVAALGIEVVDIPAERVLAGAAASFRADPAVETIELDHVRDVGAVTTDPGSPDQWSLPRIGWDTVHGHGLPTGAVTVAILDTGVDAAQPDLQGRLLPGRSFVAGSAPGTDPHGHGTWMAGIVAAAVDNGVGIAGLGGDGVRVLPITILGADGTGQDSAVIAGVMEAVDQHADVILMAFSNPGYSPALQAAIDYAWSNGVVLIAANGNDGTTTASYPAGDRGVVGVASTDRADRLASGSNHGPQTFLAAPGVDILTTAAGARAPANEDRTVAITGSSAAAAEVAGAASILRALDPAASNAVIVGRLARSAAPAGSRDETGNGRLDLARAASDVSISGVVPNGAAVGSGGPFVGPYVAAASKTWTGLGADNTWTNGLNWGGVPPLPGDDLVFPAGAARPVNVNTFPAATAFNSITILGTGYSLAGNSIALGAGGLSASGTGAANTVSVALVVAAVDPITVDGATSALTVSAVVSGVGGLAKAGAGSLVLTAANTYVGATTVNAGTIVVRSNAALGTTAGPTTVSGGGGVTIDGSALVVAEPVTLNGNGDSATGAIRNLANSNTWSGAATLASASTITSAVGTLTISGAIATAGFALTIDGTGNVTKTTAAISGTGGLVQTATGMITLSIANTYTGPTTVSAGTMKLGIANGVAAGSALSIAAGATFDINGFSDTVGSLADAGIVTNGGVAAATMTAGGTNASTTFSGVLATGTGTLALTKTGTGTLVLAGINTYSGATTISAGIVRVQSSAALGTTAGATTIASGAAIELDGSGLTLAEPLTSVIGTGVAAGGAIRNLANANTWSGAITLGSGGASVTADGGTLTISAAIGGATRPLTVGGAGNTVIGGVIGTTTGTLTKAGAGSLTLAAVNTYSGATTISAGTLKLGVANAVGPSSALTVAAGATFDLAGVNDTIGSLAGAGSVTTSAAGAVTLTAGGNNTSTTFSGVVSNGSGTVALTKAGTLILTLSGINTYTGPTTIGGGTISIAADAALGSPPASATPGQLTFVGGTLLATANLTLNANRGIAFSGAATISPNTSVTLTYGGIAAGPGSLAKTGAGTLVLSGANTYTGVTTISAGILSIAADAALGTAPASATPGQLTFSAGTLLATASFSLDPNRGIALTGAGTISTNAATTVTYGGIVAGASTLTKIGTGILALNGVNTYSGATFISAGTLLIGSDSALGAAPGAPTAGKLTFSTGTLQTSATFSLDPNRGIALTGTGTISTNAATTVTYGGIVAGASTLTKTGTGTLVLAGINTYSGATTISAGTLSIGADSGLGAAPVAATAGKLTFAGGTLQTSATLVLHANRGIALTGTGTISADPATTVTYGGIIAGASTLTKTGTGNLVLAGVNTYSGATTISAGTLSIASNAALGTAPGAAMPGHLTITGGALQTTASFGLAATRGIAIGGPGAVMEVASGSTLSYAGIVTGPGTLTLAGSGTLDLNASASVSVGGLTISGGTLVAPVAGTFSVAGDWSNNASSTALVGGAGTVAFGGPSPQAIGGSFPTTFSGLRIANATGVALGASVTVTGTLTFTAGTITTGGNIVHVAIGGSVARTSGHVIGNLAKSFAPAVLSQTFEVGDATVYAPATVDFASVSTAGDLTVSATAGEHPSIGTSTLDPSRSANRFWTIANNGIDFSTYSAVFTFVAGDLDPSVDTLHLVAEAFSAGAWTPQATGARTLTTTQAVGIDRFGDFALGELAGSAFDHFVVSAPAATTAGSAVDLTVTSVDSVGNTLTAYVGTITFSSTDLHATFPSPTYTFGPGDQGSKAFPAGAVLRAAGTQTISVTDATNSGTSAPIAVSPGPFAKLLLLVPGESADPGSSSGKSGSPAAQTANAPFDVTVQAVDAEWNMVPATDTVTLASSDGAAVLPPDGTLVAGAAIFTVTLETFGPATVTAADASDVTKTLSVSGAINVADTAPAVADDSYIVNQGNELVISAAGVLSNDTDPEGQPVRVADPRPLAGPSFGILTLNADGSFTYTPDLGFSGTDTFSYRAAAGALTSISATVTITVTTSSYVSSSGWSAAFDSTRYLSLTFPPYVAPGSSIAGATFRHTYRSDVAGDTTCYYIGVYEGSTLLATHGSAGAPISCNAGSGFVTDAVPLPEVDSPSRANDLTIRVYVSNSGGRRSIHRLATLGVTYSLD